MNIYHNLPLFVKLILLFKPVPAPADGFAREHNTAHRTARHGTARCEKDPHIRTKDHHLLMSVHPVASPTRPLAVEVLVHRVQFTSNLWHQRSVTLKKKAAKTHGEAVCAAVP